LDYLGKRNALAAVTSPNVTHIFSCVGSRIAADFGRSQVTAKAHQNDHGRKEGAQLLKFKHLLYV